MTKAIDNLTAAIKAAEAIEDTVAAILDALPENQDAIIQALADELQTHSQTLNAKLTAYQAATTPANPAPTAS